MGERHLENFVTCVSCLYTGSCNTCICATIPLQFVCFCDGKQDSGWDLMVAADWWKAISHLVFQPLESLSLEWVAVVSLGCQDSQCWAADWGCCSLRAELQGTRCQPCFTSPSRGMFGSLVHQTSSVCIKCHIKTLGLWLHFLFLGLRKLLASRGQETRNSRVTGSKALCCVCTIDLRVFFSSRTVLLQLKCNLKLFS